MAQKHTSSCGTMSNGKTGEMKAARKGTSQSVLSANGRVKTGTSPMYDSTWASTITSTYAVEKTTYYTWGMNNLWWKDYSKQTILTPSDSNDLKSLCDGIVRNRSILICFSMGSSNPFSVSCAREYNVIKSITSIVYGRETHETNMWGWKNSEYRTKIMQLSRNVEKTIQDPHWHRHKICSFYLDRNFAIYVSSKICIIAQ